uniref:Disease resistance protein RGA3 n=1 Tax=Chenopodium quinoa TaxID=63459 RepID=A0A803LBN9_CHEQI
MIQARVRDAEKYQEAEGSDTIKEWLKMLRQVLYRADDLFDEILTVDQQRPRMQVHVFFSRSNILWLNWKMAREIKSIRQELDAINSGLTSLNLRVYDHREDPKHPVAQLMKRRETASFVKAVDIIGRENDKNMIIEMLLNPKYDDEKVTVIPIVGFGGLGKTTLAQLVFNDVRVQKHFDLVTWVCVPEVDNQKAVMGKLYRCFTDEDSGDRSLNQIKSQIHDSIKSKKYLLVLDDIWDDSRDRWLDLMSLLECGRIGSKVIVTTRSDNVAKVAGTVPKSYKLGFLTDDESWELFRSLAFKQNQEESNPNLTQIGKEIVSSCGNVPLAIRVVGSLLYSKDSEKEWQLFKDDQLSKAKLMEDGNLMPVLKLSYDYLPPALKQCFAYCSLFPKDYEFSKADLVHLWMAQGYFEPSNRDIGDQYFMELLRMNFFQDPKEDGKGNVKTCKIHDLVHDLAQHIAGAENMLLGESSMQVTDELIHVSLNGWEAPSSLLATKNIRSLLGLSIERPASLEGLVSRFLSLRVLSLNNIDMVPSSIGRLRHLRYLNLARNCIECLPNAITRLENLQTLNLDSCPFLMELPRDFAKLSNLRHLVINWDTLTDLPSGFGKMTTLHELHGFIVGKGENTGIDSLPALNLRGELRIQFFKLRKNAVMEAQRATLKENQQLTSLILSFRGEETAVDSDELKRMISFLQLPQNLKYLKVLGYKGDEMPICWFDRLRKLVSISFVCCNNCRILPYLRQLPHLKSLYLQSLNALEYVEDEGTSWVGGNSGSTAHNDYFPFLEVLELEDLPRLKGWTRSSNGEALPDEISNLSLLRELQIIKCPNLASLPPSLQGLTSLQKLYIRGCPDLGKRYKKPNGKDCHILQHIPHTDISTGCELSFHDDLGFIESPEWE